MSPVQRSLNLLREEGYICHSVEHWNNFAHIRQDLWGMDILAFRVGLLGVLGIQCTTHANMSARIKKLHALPTTLAWCYPGCHRRCEVWGWGKTGKRGERKRWTVRRVAL